MMIRRTTRPPSSPAAIVEVAKAVAVGGRGGGHSSHAPGHSSQFKYYTHKDETKKEEKKKKKSFGFPWSFLRRKNEESPKPPIMKVLCATYLHRHCFLDTKTETIKVRSRGSWRRINFIMLTSILLTSVVMFLYVTIFREYHPNAVGMTLLKNNEQSNSTEHITSTNKSKSTAASLRIQKVSPRSIHMMKKYNQLLSSSSSSETISFAIVIATDKRPKQLKATLNHYANTCSKIYNNLGLVGNLQHDSSLPPENNRKSNMSKVLSQIYIIWQEPNVDPPKIEDLIELNPKNTNNNQNTNQEQIMPSIHFVQAPHSLNSRFLPLTKYNLTTDAIFMNDNDVQVDCMDLLEAFEAWKIHSDSLVGFYPRMAMALSLQQQQQQQHNMKNDAEVIMVMGNTHSSSLPSFHLRHHHNITSKLRGIDNPTSPKNFKYHSWPWIYIHKKYNMILVKAAFFHRKYLEMYHDEKEHPREILEFVQENKNCEDIAMNFLISKTNQLKRKRTAMDDDDDDDDEHQHSNLDSSTDKLEDYWHYDRSLDGYYCKDCPIYFRGKVKDDGLFNGLSSSKPKTFANVRSHCIDHFSQIYRDRGWEFPLMDMSLDKQSWKQYSSWWQYRPSNFAEWFSFAELPL